ncbi:MAG: ogr/Delta-like zinc finger family protein [Proteobacteria bacterium]|nr:ogr/Delta-like zinc finger family protein [Pseudomonadota bacterium]
MAGTTITRIALASKEAAAGVDFSSRTGAPCPGCGKRAKIYKTMPWEDNTRIRYHRCENSKCALSSLGTTVKSIEVDMVGE